MLEVHSLVQNEWVPPGSHARVVRDASTGEVIGKTGHDGLPFSDMISYAKGKGGTALRAMGFHERAKMIKALALYLMERKDNFYPLSYHTGATHTDSMIDIDGGIQTMLVFASKGRREMPDGQIYIDGDIEELSRDGSFKGMHIATPLLGVAVHINAFNFPVWGMLEKLAPSLLAAVPVIVKPASQTAYLTEAVVRAMIESDILPKGAIQLVSGSAGDLLDYLGPQDVVSFTGSAETASKLRANANILRHSVRFIAEQDSLNATILGSDVAVGSDDFAIFLKEVVKEIITKAGQKCTAIRRIFVPEAHIDAVGSALSKKLGKVKIGDPRAEDTRMGALVSIEQCADVLAKAEILQKEAKLIFGEIPKKCPEKQAFFSPLLFHCKNPDKAKSIHSVEAFGPVSTLMGYRDIEHAVALLNKGGGSLVASVITNSGEIARKIAYEAGPWHGRLYFNNIRSLKASTGHGSPLPHLVHGGPGRAGGGEEMGGIRGVLHYMQRTAIQGHPDILTAIGGNYVPNGTRLKAPAHPFTIAFNQLEIGQSIETNKREVTLEDIKKFAHFTGDLFYAHMNEEAAQASPFFSERVAHGYLLLSFAAGLFVDPKPGPVLANTGLNNLRFLKPVIAGDAIYAKLTVKRKTRRTDEYGEIRWHVEINNQDDERVAEYELLTMNAYHFPMKESK